MAVITATGDRVFWDELERVDLDDFIAASDLSLQASADVGGAIVGRGSATYQHGLMSRLVYDGAAPTQVTFEPFKVGFVEPGVGDHDPAGLSVAVYDPSTSLTASLDFTGYTGLFPYVWARREQYPGTVANRRYWDDTAAAEATRSQNTRILTRVRLDLSDLSDATMETPPQDGESRWVKVARAGSVGGSVSLNPRSIFDKPDPEYELDPGNSDLDSNAVKYYPLEREGEVGLTDALTAVFASLSKVYDGLWKFDLNTFLTDSATTDSGAQTAIDGWRDNLANQAFRGLRQLQEELDDIDVTIVDAMATAPQILLQVVAPLHGGGTAYGIGMSRADPAGGVAIPISGTQVAVGAGLGFNLTVVIPPNWQVFDVRVSGQYQGVPVPYNDTVQPVTYIVTPVDTLDNTVSFPLVGDGVTQHLLKCAAFYKGNVGNNDFVPITPDQYWVSIIGTRA